MHLRRRAFSFETFAFIACVTSPVSARALGKLLSALAACTRRSARGPRLARVVPWVSRTAPRTAFLLKWSALAVRASHLATARRHCARTAYSHAVPKSPRATSWTPRRRGPRAELDGKSSCSTVRRALRAREGRPAAPARAFALLYAARGASAGAPVHPATLASEERDRARPAGARAPRTARARARNCSRACRCARRRRPSRSRRTASRSTSTATCRSTSAARARRATTTRSRSPRAARASGSAWPPPRAAARAHARAARPARAATAAPGQHITISVSFQSALNSEIWWSDKPDEHGCVLGVVARPMGRRPRPGGSGSRSFLGDRLAGGGLFAGDYADGTLPAGAAHTRSARPRARLRGPLVLPRAPARRRGGRPRALGVRRARLGPEPRPVVARRPRPRRWKRPERQAPPRRRRRLGRRRRGGAGRRARHGADALSQNGDSAAAAAVAALAPGAAAGRARRRPPTTPRPICTRRLRTSSSTASAPPPGPPGNFHSAVHAAALARHVAAPVPSAHARARAPLGGMPGSLAMQASAAGRSLLPSRRTA